MSAFSVAHKFTAEWEGGLTDDPVDRGGLTKYGVSLEFLKDVANESQANRDTLDRMGIRLPVTKAVIRELTLEKAQSLFRWQFWDRLKLDRFAPRVATVLYDAAVNCGRSTSVRLMQRGWNATAVAAPYLDTDGILGPKSEAAFLVADKFPVLDAAIEARVTYYHAIVKSRPEQARFLRGWLNRANALKDYIHKVEM